MNWWTSSNCEFLISMYSCMLQLRKMEPFVVNMTRPLSLKVCCLRVIGIHLDMLLDACNSGHIPIICYNFLQRTSSTELLDRMKERNNLSEKHVHFFLNPFIKELNLDAFCPTEIKNILHELNVIGKVILRFRLTRFVYPKHILLQLIDLLPNLQTLCLDKTRCSNKVLKFVAKNCPCLKTLDVRECLDIGDEGIKSLCKRDENGAFIKNLVLQELDIWSTDVSIPGILFAIEYFPNLTKLDHYLLCSAIYRSHLFSALGAPKDVTTATKIYNFKELAIHPVNGLNAEILRMYSVLCPKVTLLQIFGLETQDEINVCEAFSNLTEASLFVAKNIVSLSLTSLIRSRGRNLTKLEIGYATVSLESLSQCCPQLQSLYMQHCELEDLDNLLHGAFFTLSELRLLTLDDVVFPLIDESIKMILLSSPNLEQLTLLYVISVTDEFVNELASFSFVPCLRTIELIYSTIKVSAVVKLIETIPNLERIFIDRCHLSNHEYYSLVQLGQQNLKIQLVIKNTTHTEHYFNSHCPNTAEDREIWGYGFDYEDDFESDIQINW